MRENINKLVTVVFLIAMVILCFFQKCSVDIYVLILAFAVAAMAIFNSYHQNKKLKDLNDNQLK